MVLTRTSVWRLARSIGTLACFAAPAAGTAFRPGPASAQSPPMAQPVEPGPAAGTPSPAVMAPIEGFRAARFGMSEPEVRRAIQQDFPAGARRLLRTTHPRERTTVLTIMAEELLPDAGLAQLSYILGYASKRLIQVNVVWSSDGRSAARDEAVVAAANVLRDHFLTQRLAPPDETVTNQRVGENAFLVFRATQADSRMVLLLLSGAAAAGRANQTPAPPLTLQLAYISNYKIPDVFHIERGHF